MKGLREILFAVMVLISGICLANGRQIRYSRYATEISEGDVDEGNIVEPFEIEATVREIKFAPYPPAGYRPSQPFPLPSEQGEENLSGNVTDEPESLSLTTTTETTDVAEEVTEENSVNAPYPAAGFKPKIPFNLPERNEPQNQKVETTTEIPVSESTTATVEDDGTTTITFMPEVSTPVPLADFTTRPTEEPMIDVTTTMSAEVENKAPYPAAGFRPKIPFNLPTRDQVQETEVTEEEAAEAEEEEVEVVKAPYPPAGFRPSIAFLLPNEQLNEPENKDDNSKHPACGSSTNPLAPKPLDGAKADPDSETIYVNPQMAIQPMPQSTDDNSEHPPCGSSTTPLAPKPLDGAKKEPNAETIYVNPQTVVVPVRLTARPVFVARPLVYTAAHIPVW